MKFKNSTYKNKKGFVTGYVYLILLGVSIISSSIFFGYIGLRQLSYDALYSMKSFYSAESGIEEGLLAYKKNPNPEDFVGEDKLLDEEQRRELEYRDQNVYRKELIIEEVIPAGKSIQFFFRKEELDPNITKFHIGFLKRPTTAPELSADCSVSKYNAATEIGAYQKANVINVNPLDYNVDLGSNWNGCFVANNSTGKKTIVYYTDPFSNEKYSYIGDKCILNNKGNVSSSVFETDIPYAFDDRGNTNVSDNTCTLDCSSGGCSNFYTYDSRVQSTIRGYLKFYTIAPNIVHSDLTDESLLVFDIRAVDEDSQIMMWATDDAGNAYDIPGRYINITATGVSSQGNIKEGLFTRLTVKKKANTDLLPIFNFSLYSESEFIK